MPATAPIIHADQQELSELVGLTLSLAKETGLLLDSDVGGAKTLATMQAAVATNAAPLHASFQGYVGRVQRGLDYGAAIGVLTTANIQGVTTLAELIAITPASSLKKGGPLFIE